MNEEMVAVCSAQPKASATVVKSLALTGTQMAVLDSHTHYVSSRPQKGADSAGVMEQFCRRSGDLPQSAVC